MTKKESEASVLKREYRCSFVVWNMGKIWRSGERKEYDQNVLYEKHLSKKNYGLCLNVNI